MGPGSRLANVEQPVRDQTRDAFNGTLEYLDHCGIFVPDFRLRILAQLGGSYVIETERGVAMTLGCYPATRSARWFAMHELAHALAIFYRPERNRRFKKDFGAPTPGDYDHQQMKTALPREIRPDGFPSYYGRDGGGEELFAELVAFMYTEPRKFASRPPADLNRLWKVAWDDGLSRMTKGKFRP